MIIALLCWFMQYKYVNPNYIYSFTIEPPSSFHLTTLGIHRVPGNSQSIPCGPTRVPENFHGAFISISECYIHVEQITTNF